MQHAALHSIRRRKPYFLKRSHVIALAIVLVLATGASVVLGRWMGAYDRKTIQVLKQPPPASPTPLNLRKLAPEEAVKVNRAIPFDPGPRDAAKPFRTTPASTDRMRAVECLTSAVYYEAGNQDVDGMRAVAQVILNRVRHPAFQSNVCGVVFAGSERVTGCQFTFTCDGSLARTPNAAIWSRSRRIAEEALGGSVYAPVGLATHYHADYVVPYWASSLSKKAAVGRHIFYTWRGPWGTPPAFRKRYAGGEPIYAELASKVLRSAATTQPTLTATGTALTESSAMSSRSALSAEVRQASPEIRLAAIETQIALAQRTLGPNHPQLIELKKERESLAAHSNRSTASQLAAVDALIAAARVRLGPKHPEVVALVKKRSALSSGKAEPR